MAAAVYDNAPKHLMNGDIAYATDTIKCMLLSAYTPSQAHDTIADVLAAGTEASGSGYTARGAALGTKTIATATNVTTVGCANVVWTTSNPGTLTGLAVVFYKDTGTNSTSYVISYDVLTSTTASNGGTLTVDCSSGIATVTV